MNLLDNWDFSDPVNQRGKSTYTGTGIYAIDRWKFVDKTGTLTVKSGGIGISFNSSEGFTSIGQYFENLEDLIGKTATASVLLSDGTIKSVTFKNLQSNSDVSGADFDVGYLNLIMPYKCFRIMITKNSSVTIKAVKLELGEVSTLKNDVLGVNYAKELLKCQKYFERSRYQVTYGTALNTNVLEHTDNYFYKKEKRIDECIFTVDPVPSQPLQVYDVSDGKLELVSNCILVPPTTYNNYCYSPRIESPNNKFITGRRYLARIGDNAYSISADL